jgi:hypothetical protein
MTRRCRYKQHPSRQGASIGEPVRGAGRNRDESARLAGDEAVPGAQLQFAVDDVELFLDLGVKV